MEPGPSSIENDAHGIEKLLLKTQVSLTRYLQSEVKIIHIIVQIIHIIVQDQDGQNNNMFNLIISRCKIANSVMSHLVGGV